ncbi:MAG: DUF982 domain-containing protein, partial [Mesorhizobium sp.]
PARLETVAEAYALLQDWPAASRSSAHAIALNACKAGIAGEIDAETVRATLVAFARRNDILAPDMVSLRPRRWQGARPQATMAQVTIAEDLKPGACCAADKRPTQEF